MATRLYRSNLQDQINLLQAHGFDINFESHGGRGYRLTNQAQTSSLLDQRLTIREAILFCKGVYLASTLQKKGIL